MKRAKRGVDEPGGEVVVEDVLNELSESDKTYLLCRRVNIGSYKTVPKDKVLITTHGIKLTVHVLNSPAECVELKISHDDLIKVLVHFGRQRPVLFFYTQPAAAAKIRKALKMENKNDFYYDVVSNDETHKRMTFLPDHIEEGCKQKLKSIFNNDPEKNIYTELSSKEAINILFKASPKEMESLLQKLLHPLSAPRLYDKSFSLGLDGRPNSPSDQSRLSPPNSFVQCPSNLNDKQDLQVRQDVQLKLEEPSMDIKGDLDSVTGKDEEIQDQHGSVSPVHSALPAPKDC